MNLEDFASVADILSAVALVVSLIYVGIQVNDSTSAIRSAAASDATTAMQSWYLEMGRNRQASDVWLNAMRSPDPLPANDEFQFLMSMHAAILGMQNSYLLSKEGTLDVEFREAVTTAIKAVKDLPGMGRYWRQRKGFFHTDFAKYVDGLLAQDAIETLDIYKKMRGGGGSLSSISNLALFLNRWRVVQQIAAADVGLVASLLARRG